MIREYKVSGLWAVPSVFPGKRFFTFQEALKALLNAKLKKKKLKVDSCRKCISELGLSEKLLQRDLF